jgi:carbon-monoxide dehydrogenase large subunit
MSGPTGVGAPVRRKEDPPHLTGTACFTADLHRPGEAHAAVVRSPHAHARLGRIDTAAARTRPGVLLVLTAEDVRDEISHALPSYSRTPPFDVRGRDGAPAPEAEQFPLARDRVRYPGEAVAFVVAETPAHAQDAAELVTVEYRPLPAVVDLEQALAPDAPRLWDDVSGNVSFDWEHGDAEAVETALARAAHVARVTVANNRIAVAFMEPRGALAEFDTATGRWTLWAGCQSAHRIQELMAYVLGVDTGRVRVVVPDMGGGFGARAGNYPEFPLLLVAARRLGRPVRWIAERTESFLTDTQARDHVLRGELGQDERGRFTAIRVHADWRHGAYFAARSVWTMLHYLTPTLGGAYRIPCGHLSLRGVFTNTTPLGAYRGIGRVEANYIVESLVDAAARDTGIDRLELRRRNVVSAAELPWTTPGGAVLTSGAFAENLERAARLADWNGFPARRAAARASRRLSGIGVALYVENDGTIPSEFAEAEATPDGRVVVRVGTQDFGMGHATIFSQVAATILGVPFDCVEIVFGDTDRVERGVGSMASRSARMGGGAVVFGSRKLVEVGREVAARMLEAAAVDLSYEAGRYRVAGTDRGVDLSAVAAFAAAGGQRLIGQADFVTTTYAHANGCHVAEVSLDPEDGTVRLERLSIVADVGRAINPLIVHGQLHGGAAQGVGQALWEEVSWDPQSGQPLSASFLSYAVARADNLPAFDVELNEIPEADNPLGVKGAGESATTGAPAAVMNALRDALQAAGAGPVDMPATPERVYQALQRGPAHTTQQGSDGSQR